jgi:hypothetical protein
LDLHLPTSNKGYRSCSLAIISTRLFFKHSGSAELTQWESTGEPLTMEVAKAFFQFFGGYPG